jgi:uracil-DNA glycosylase family protein
MTRAFESKPVPAATEPLHRLAAAAAGCRECPLGERATQTVWGEGRSGALLMLVGEQPGDREDQAGRPFVGPAGALLRRALAQLGWPDASLYITNAVKHFKYELRGKRRIHKTPAQREVLACNHWLEEEVAAVRPVGLVALGGVAARSLMGHAVPVMRERGRWQTSRPDGIPVLVTMHPSALLRGDPAGREAAYDDWLADLRQASRLLHSAR